MKLLVRFSSLTFLFLMVGCTVTASTAGQKINTIDENLAKRCTFVDYIYEIDYWGIDEGSIANAISKAKNKAAMIGADSLHILDTDINDSGGVVKANSYKCND